MFHDLLTIHHTIFNINILFQSAEWSKSIYRKKYCMWRECITLETCNLKVSTLLCISVTAKSCLMIANDWLSVLCKRSETKLENNYIGNLCHKTVYRYIIQIFYMYVYNIMIQSCCNFVHAKTAEQLWYVQICNQIWSLKLQPGQKEFSCDP